MQGYSIGGYINAIARRSVKTMMVEGVNDRSVLNRLKLEKASVIGHELPGVIDVADILTGDEVSGLGKKAIIKSVLSALSETPATVAQKFGTLVDREWDGLTLDMDLQNPWNAPIQGSPNFITVGHSVENYFFRLSPIEAFLKQFFSDRLDQIFFNDLMDRFHSIIGFAVVYSLGMRHIGAISRADRIINRRLVEWHGDRYISTSALNSSLIARGVNAAQNVYLFINSAVATYLDRFTHSEPGHWLCHGHLGEQAIWACVANLAEEHAVPGDVAMQIERGLADVRFRHCVDYLCRQTAHLSAPLDSAVDWLIA